jgi:hypothetical protein
VDVCPRPAKGAAGRQEREGPSDGGDLHPGFVASLDRTPGTLFEPLLPGCPNLQPQNGSIPRVFGITVHRAAVRVKGRRRGDGQAMEAATTAKRSIASTQRVQRWTVAAAAAALEPATSADMAAIRNERAMVTCGIPWVLAGAGLASFGRSPYDLSRPYTGLE